MTSTGYDGSIYWIEIQSKLYLKDTDENLNCAVHEQLAFICRFK